MREGTEIKTYLVKFSFLSPLYLIHGVSTLGLSHEDSRCAYLIINNAV